MLKVKIGTVVFLAALLLLASCAPSPGSDVRSEIVTAENSSALDSRARSELSYEEYQLLAAYVKRVHPDQPEGSLPVGITVGTMIESERAYRASRPESAEASAGEANKLAPAAASEDVRGESMEEKPAPPAAPASASAAPASAASSPAVEPETPTPASAAAADTGRHASAGPTEREIETSPEPPPPPKPVLVPRGTTLSVRLSNSISSKSNQAGDSFETTLEDDLLIDGHLLAEAGSRVIGRITEAAAAGKVKGKARMSIRLVSLEAGSEVREISTNSLTFEAQGSTKQDAAKIGIASGVGAVIGAIAGGKKGAAIGAVVGGGAGTGVVLATPGDEVEFRSEQLFAFQLQKDIELPIL